MTRQYTKLILNIMITTGMLAVVCDNIHADSLWQKRVTINYNLFDDNRGKRVGDIVTVVVSESTAIANDENATTNNSSSNAGSVDYNKFMRGVLSALRTGRNAKFTDREANTFSNSYNSDFSGKGSYDSTRSVNLNITAMVVEVLDNGNLALEGKRDIAVNKETYTLKLTGIARPIDISPENLISSSKMSNVIFDLSGKGWLTRAGSKGWFNRVKDVLWPF
ncbi:flagellar basal body L-ring protein [Candidatus Scalindua japonica]|uniref:Flagellar basal body L-ring protein n=1 Tax=Candidatus Scalindua japonica TaxID=1284222 RepID=A0A286TVB1_9BACT|nr:flagellar basal body L-ring protein FlgH [Candidatus Scalindua japonica]GAX59809.1 flagellar basal body L-ring protein [Candidatus Scalindua japonica]